jgi:hypothetical protein
MFSPLIAGDENQAERRLNSAFRRHSESALYGLDVIELCAQRCLLYAEPRPGLAADSLFSAGCFLQLAKKIRKKEKIK